ncbi:MAG: hypothetical protein IJ485_01350, partial [Lachnospiraceae bacterium]|nr:hypothetical protein [Lachnospiraceae bacterium]
STAFVSILLMFIGGSPVSTAGGIKTTTIALVCIATISSLRSRENAVIVYTNRIPKRVSHYLIYDVLTLFGDYFFSGRLTTILHYQLFLFP